MDTSWFELRVVGEKVAAFSYGDSGQTYNKARELVFDFLRVTRDDLYKDKKMQIVEVWRVQSRNEKGEPSFLLDDTVENVVHEVNLPDIPDVYNYDLGAL
jgi:hypothetical protein